MKPTERLIFDLGRSRHPLGGAIRPEEVSGLIENLRNRLGASSKELNLSPSSLRRLEGKLVELYKKMPNPSDEELVLLMREITAYTGEVLVIHAGGAWDPRDPTLWHTSIVINKPRERIKDGERYIVPSVNFVVGALAAWTWDAIPENGKPHLYQLYRETKSKRLREKL